MSGGLREWLVSMNLSEKSIEDVEAAADTLDDLLQAFDDDLETVVKDWKLLPKTRFLRAVRELRGGGENVAAAVAAARAPPAAPTAPVTAARCDKCDGAHATAACPFYSKKRVVDDGSTPFAKKKKRGRPPKQAAETGPTASTTESRTKASTERPRKQAAGSSDRRRDRNRDVHLRVHGSLKHSPEARLSFLPTNPKARLTSEHGQKAAARYAAYSACETVGDFYANRGTTADLIYDIASGYCAVLDDGHDAAALGPVGAAQWAARFDELVWIQQQGFKHPWPAIILDPDEAAEPVKSRAKRAAGVEYLVWNFQTDDGERFAFSAPQYLWRWADGFDKGFHRSAWTGKYAGLFAAAVEEADELFRARDGEAANDDGQPAPPAIAAPPSPWPTP